MGIVIYHNPKFGTSRNTLAMIRKSEFDEAGGMKPSSHYDRVVDVMEELMKFTLLTCDIAHYLTDRYSERVKTAAELTKRVNLVAAAGE